MPIIPQETTIFPANLLDDHIALGGDGRWWGVYTKARQEKSLARQLLSWQIPFYLPLVPKDNLIRGRHVRAHLPLFDGYVFLFGSNEERIRALTTNRISRILAVDDQELLHRDLCQVRQLIAAGAPLTIERRLAPGRRVRVKSGAMLGLEGTVIARRNTHRLLVAITFLQQGASVAIDDFMVEPID